MLTLDPALVDLAAAQQGAFSSRQASHFGVSRIDLHRLVARGDLIHVRRGAFLLAGALEGLTAEAGYAVRTRAVLLSRPQQSWASHHAALAVSGLPLVGLDLNRFDVCADVRRESRSGSVTTHALPTGEPCLLVNGVPCVSTETALLQTAVRHGVRSAVVAADAALHRGLVGDDTLAEAAARLDLGVRSAARVGRLRALVDPASESPGESLTRLLLGGLGLGFRSQVDIRDDKGFVGRVDFLVEGRIILEFDGLVKYDGAQGREALAAEKRREDRLRAAGYEVVRLTWADLDRPEKLARRLREARARARARRSGPSNLRPTFS
ncbi:MAG TPA: type IV toxin-antitoxin system AbiEi family antitoxin domain-containing protein [Pedococcus sp.]